MHGIPAISQQFNRKIISQLLNNFDDFFGKNHFFTIRARIKISKK